MKAFVRVLALTGALSLAGLALAAPASNYRSPRTASGAPDLQGVWSNASMTRLERPPEASSLVVSEQEASVLERRLIAKQRKVDGADTVGQYDSEWLEGVDHLARLGGQARTSWLVSPADGKLPFTAEGNRQVDAIRAARLTAFDGPEARSVSERCLSSGMGSGGAPILNQVAAALYQIVQTRDAVVIVSESNHEARIIPLNGHHLPQQMRVWMGDPLGHWEKDTLVVESTNFRADESNRMQMILSADAKVTERFTRTSPTEIRYEFTIEDPAFYSQSWRAEMPFVASKGAIFEFACHEGNYSLPDTLAGARYQDMLARKRETAAAR
jgi:hypothetical protein